MAFRVGVVGHRPDRLPLAEPELARLRVRIGEVLAAVAAAVADFAKGPGARFYLAGAAPILTANSPLAEGADRLFAEEAMGLGYRLTCVMPFAMEAFEHDFVGPDSFEPESLARFRDILARAEAAGTLTRFELNGRRERTREAYESAGRVVLNQSDLMVVVWDGGGANGVGGTVDTLREAIEFNVPTLWIDSRAPYGWKLLRVRADLECLYVDGACAPSPEPAARTLQEVIGEVVAAELDVPGAEDRRLEVYQAETRPALNLAVGWKMFRDFMDMGALRLPILRTPDFESQVRAAWPTDGDPEVAAGAAASWINQRLRSHYAWSDKLADHYADAHRSGFVWSSLLASTAVLTALLPMAGHLGVHASEAIAVLEALVLALLVGLPMLARRDRWHQKWLEYRVLAELVRELRILIPLGGARPAPRTPAHLANYGDPTRSWMYWQARAVARAVGLPDARITGGYVERQLAELLTFVGDPSHGQIGFHEMNCARMERIHHRLHRMSLILFAGTLGAVAANWFLRFTFPTAPQKVADWLILFSAVLPALGASLASINNQGEFARLQRRSRAMAESLAAIRERIAALAAEPATPPLAAVADLAAQIATMMVDENTEWRIVVLDLPHAAG
ncbi:MAG TPA: hypothetical protein VIB82_05015 [Caulobacteraceae bacterium]|jgi:hypothetical protein